jgi:hypothetical protein
MAPRVMLEPAVGRRWLSARMGAGLLWQWRFQPPGHHPYVLQGQLQPREQVEPQGPPGQKLWPQPSPIAAGKR